MAQKKTGIFKKCIVCGKEYYVTKKRIEESKYCSRKCRDKDKSLKVVGQNRKIINCLNCNKEIELILSSDKKYCCKECRLEYKKKNNLYKKTIKQCLQCKQEFYVHNYEKDSKKFCCVDCYNKWQTTELNPLRNRKIIKCLNCNCDIEIGSKCKKHKKFCSLKCFGEYSKKTGESKQRQQFKINKIFKKCKHCNKEFEVHNYRKDTALFCSTNCKFEYDRNIKICPICKKEFSSAKYLGQKYCSRKCACKVVNWGTSKFSSDIFNELQKIFLNNIEREFYIKIDNFKFFTDIRIGNVIIECNGDYWHCNPIKYDKLYYHKLLHMTAEEKWIKDKDRINKIKSLGYDIIIIWETDYYKNRYETIQQLILKINEIQQNNKN